MYYAMHTFRVSLTALMQASTIIEHDIEAWAACSRTTRPLGFQVKGRGWSIELKLARSEERNGKGRGEGRGAGQGG